MKRLAPILPLLLILTSCVHAQLAGGIGGTGGNGGNGAVGNSNPRLTITKPALNSATVGTAYSDTLTAVNGTLPLSWTIAFGSLPPGLTLNSTTGVISGTPTTTGNYLFTVIVFDSTTPTAKTATKDMSITVSCDGLAISSTSPIPPGTQGLPYSFQFQAQGGLLPLSWSGTSIPSGLSLNSAGLLSGTPSAAGQSTLNVTVTDSCTPTAQSANEAASLTINGTVVITSTSPLPDGTVGQGYSATLSASGGTTPYVWTLASGTLPGGLSLAANGVISGTPSNAQTSTFTVKVTDASLVSNTAPFTITVACPPLTVSSTSPLPAATQNVAYRFQFVSNGGVAPIAWTTPDTLPNGLTLSPSGLLSGTPTAAGTFTFNIVATDNCSTAQTVTTPFTITVGNALVITSTSPLPNGTVGQPYSDQIVAQGGVPPYTWSVPSGSVPAGAIDLLDFLRMRLPDSTTSHMAGTVTPGGTAASTYSVLQAGTLWNIKSGSGNPWDIRYYDDKFIYFEFTENNDSDQQAACQLAGYASCFVDPFAYKQVLNVRQFAPRYFVLGGPDVVINLPGPNMGLKTTNCGADNQAPRDLGNLVLVIHDAGTGTNYGGSVGSAHTVTISYYQGLNSVTPPYQSGLLETYYFAYPFGRFQHTQASWNGTSYAISQTTLVNNKVSGGAPTPNFACGIPPVPVSNTLPLGTKLTSGPSLDLNASTGILSGTPVQSGTSAFTIQVEDSVGTIAQAPFTLAVNCPAFSITSVSPLPNATQGSAYTFGFQSSGGIAPVIWTESGTLPAGMTFTSAGVLAGTPTNFGTFLFTITATDSCQPAGQARQKTFSLTVSANSGPLTISTASPLPAGTQGVAYSAQLQATGGTTPYTWAISSGHLPPGLTLHPATGVIDGTPTAVESDSPTFRVTDAISTTTTKVLAISTSCPTLTMVSSSPLPNGVQNSPYNFQFQATGGITPYVWTRTGGAFPTGLTLTSGGSLSGTPTASGSFSPVVQVADACSPTPQSASNTFALTISTAVQPLVITTTSPLAPGVVGKPYSTTLSATGGVTPYFWSVTSGTLPAGLALNGTTGVISGTPTTAQTVTPTIQLTDNVGTIVSQVFSITISCPPLTLTSTSPLPAGTQNSPYSFQFVSAGGIAPIGWAVTVGSLPSGLTLTSGGLLSGTPTGSGSSTFTVRATDSCSTPQTQSTSFTLVINAAPNPLQITTSSPLPSGTVNKAYTATVSATGGTAPYGSWTVTSGSLPTGLTLNSVTGVISGTPTVVQTTTPTIRVTDNVSATASKAFSISILAATAADNRYCNANEVSTLSGTFDGPAQQIQNCVRTALTDTPATVATKTVCASGCDFTTIQAASNAAVPGWTIQIKAKTAATQNIFAGANITTSGTASNWIIYESDLIASCPAEGSRVSPAYVGITSLPGRPNYSQPGTAGIYMPKIRGGNNTITLASGVHHLRFICLEITSTNGTSISNIVTQTNNDHIIWDRISIHGGDSATGQDRDNIARAFSWTGCTYCAVIDSYLYDMHCVAGGTCTDAQGILLGGNAAVTEGPFKVVDDFIEASSEPVFAGGGGTGATNTVPHDLEFRRSHTFHPLFWKGNDPSYFGTSFTVKNLFELKNLDRVLMEGFIAEQTWEGQADQHGHAILLGAKNQASAFGGTASSNGTGTITKLSGAFAFNANQVSPNCAIPLHCNFKFNGIVYPVNTVVSGTVVTVGPNRISGSLPPSNGGAAFLACQQGQNPNAVVSNVTVRYSQISHSKNGFQIFTASSDCGDLSHGGGNISIHDISLDDIDGATWVSAPGARSGNQSLPMGQISNGTGFSPPFNLHDITIRHVTGLSRLSSGNPAGGFGPGIFFTDQQQPGTSITNLKVYDSIFAAGLQIDQIGVCGGTSRFISATAVLQCVTSISGVGPASYCFDHNVLATTTATSGASPQTVNNPPWPSASPNCPFPLTGNQLPASYDAIKFTNLNGAIGGNYQLLNTSPYHNTASDGTDPGVNWTLLQNAIAGVY